MDILDKTPRRHPQTAGRSYDDEAILILSEASEINVLNSVGTRIFDLADGEHSSAAIAAIIAEEYEVPEVEARVDVVAFLAELVAREVLIWDED